MNELTRERVVEEIDALDRDISALVSRIATIRVSFTPELEAQVSELEQSIVYARQFATSNTMDFRKIELGQMELRSLKSDILKTLKN